MWAVAVVFVLATMGAITAWMTRRARRPNHEALDWSSIVATSTPRKSPVPGGNRLTGSGSGNTKNKVIPAKKNIGCDVCGYSKVDGSRHMMISYARYEVRTPAGSIYLCGHHRLSFAPVITDRGYETCAA